MDVNRQQSHDILGLSDESRITDSHHNRLLVACYMLLVLPVK